MNQIIIGDALSSLRKVPSDVADCCVTSPPYYFREVRRVLKPSGTVLDPFLGSGSTAEVAKRPGRNCIGIEINPEYKLLIMRRTGD